MIAWLLQRLAWSAATFLLAVCLVFLAIRVIPGDPLLAQFGQHADPEQMAALRRENGWDRPLPVQLVEFLWKLATTGDLGESIARSNARVARELNSKIPATIELSLAALAIAAPIGLAAGAAAAIYRGKWPDLLCTSGTLLGVSVPVFFLGIMLRAMFPQMPTSARLPLDVVDFEPLTGLMTLDTLLRGRFELFFPAIRHLCLPAIALSTIPAAMISRITRTSLLDSLSADYVRTARAKGASPARAVWGHAFPNAAAPVANMVGFQAGALLSGAVLTETVFDWHGMGQYTVQAVLANDYVVVQAGAVVIAAMYVSLNFALDLLHFWLDPRIRDR